MRWVDLGQKKYLEVWQLQEKLRQLRLKNEIEDLILFVEHTPVISIGKQKDAVADFLTPSEELQKLGFDLIPSNRGGRLTYHGPGQMVIYFVFDLRQRGVSIKQLVHQLEEACLSVPEKSGYVKRYQNITVEALDENGNNIKEKYEDLPAIIFQHEIDHTNGILFIDKIIK